MWAKTTRRPVDTFAVLAAMAASLIIIVNAVFLQVGAHPAPFFAPPKSAPVAVNLPPKPAESPPPVRQIVTAPVMQPAAPRRNDLIADLIGPSPRIAAVQRVLSVVRHKQIVITVVVIVTNAAGLPPTGLVLQAGAGSYVSESPISIILE